MTHDEIRAMLDRNLARAWAIHERAEARRAAERAALVNAPPRAPVTPAEPAKPRIGRRMRELADIVSAMPGCSKSDGCAPSAYRPTAWGPGAS